MLMALGYGVLACVAMWATWRNFELFWVGFWLVFGWAASNLLFAYAPVEARPGPYTVIEMMVALAAFCAFAEHRYKALIGVVMFNVASIAINVAFATLSDPDQRQIYLYEVTTNLCWAGQCLLAAGVGVAHGRRTGRFPHWPLVRRDAAQPDAAREADR